MSVSALHLSQGNTGVAMAVKPSSAKRSTDEAKSNPAVSYNEFKEYEGQRYTGMKIGRSHKWRYDQGEWKETKITPDLWQISTERAGWSFPSAIRQSDFGIDTKVSSIPSSDRSQIARLVSCARRGGQHDTSHCYRTTQRSDRCQD